MVTVYGDTVVEQINFSKYSIKCGASGLILQPPSQKMDEANLVNFFSDTIASVNCPVGILNAPEFLGFGLSTRNWITIANNHANFTITKLECSAVNLQLVALTLGGSVMLFNGRCGLE